MIITQPDRVLLTEQIARHAGALRGTLLDVGSGRSRRYASLLKNVTSYKTLDASTAGNPDIVGSAEKIPLPDGSIDSILCTQVLEHVPHPATALQEMHRVLKSGGYILLTVPQMNELHEIPHDYFRYTCFGLRTLFEEAGFTIEALEQRGKYRATAMQMRIRYLIDRFHPYENRFAMLLLAPLTYLLTHIAIFLDSLVRNEASKRHAIGWCVLATKPS